MKHLKSVLLVVLLPLGAACSNSGAGYTPMVDGTRNASFATDLTACQSLARSQPVLDGQTGNATVVGAAIGGVLGAADDDATLGEGLIGGAIGGALSDTVQTSSDRKSIVITCMQQRGHNVVG